MFFFSSRRRHTRVRRDWSSDVCSSDLTIPMIYMPSSIRDWGAGAVMLLVLAVVIARAEITGRRKRAAHGETVEKSGQ